MIGRDLQLEIYSWKVPVQVKRIFRCILYLLHAECDGPPSKRKHTEIQMNESTGMWWVAQTIYILRFIYIDYIVMVDYVKFWEYCMNFEGLWLMLCRASCHGCSAQTMAGFCGGRQIETTVCSTVSKQIIFRLWIILLPYHSILCIYQKV